MKKNILFGLRGSQIAFSIKKLKNALFPYTNRGKYAPSGNLLNSKKAILPLLALFFSPIGIIILVILALLAFGLIGFGVFLTLNLLTIGGIILIIAGLIAVINGQINQFTIIIIILGIFLLISPMIFSALGNLTLAAVLA